MGRSEELAFSSRRRQADPPVEFVAMPLPVFRHALHRRPVIVAPRQRVGVQTDEMRSAWPKVRAVRPKRRTDRYLVERYQQRWLTQGKRGRLQSLFVELGAKLDRAKRQNLL